MNDQLPKVSVIIVTWNGSKHISDCLELVEKSAYSNYEIIAVDNGSKDGTPELIRRKFPRVKLILNKKNLGFAGGNNQGIKKAEGEIIFLLNDDTKIHPDLIGVLAQELESSSQIGIVGPKIYFMHEPNKVWFAGGKIDWAKGKSYHLGRNLTDKELIGDLKKEVDFITGCALMIKREVINKIGLLDEVFFAFYEDADWCQKAKKAGYQVVYIPFGGVWHIKSATASRLPLIKQKFLAYRNRFIFYMRHNDFKRKITFLIRFISDIFQ